MLLGWAIVGILGGAAAADEPTPRKPNFLFILSDDQRHDALGVVQREQGERGRFPWLKTPHLDELAADGVRFRNAFVVNSLCSPSRASLLTGRYGHANGIVDNHTAFPEQSVTVASLLKQAGYATGYVGKWHMGGQRGQRPGFDSSASFIGQGEYFDCPFEINGVKTATSGWVDDVSTSYAETFLRENQAKPFVLIVGFKSCHAQFQPPPRHAAAYAGEKARTTPNMNVPAPYPLNENARKQPLPGTADATGMVETKLDYFRTINGIDDNVGRLMKLLDELKLADDTIVVFAGDNGFYLGEHRLSDKRSGYEESMRIPLIVRYPKAGKGRLVDQLALNIDLAPTFLDFAGVPVPADMHGRSWRPLIEGKSPDDWRKAFFYSYFYERSAVVPTVTAVRTETAKLIKYPGHDEWTEYFDLMADPYETKNLAKDPAAAALREQLDAEFAKQAAAIDFKIPAFADTPPAPGAEPPKRGRKNRDPKE